MEVVTLHLCRINIFTSVKSFLEELQDDKSVQVLMAGRPRNMIYKPTVTDQQDLLARYDVVLLLRSPSGAIPSNLRSHVWYEYKVTAASPAPMVATYAKRSAQLVAEAGKAKLQGNLEKHGDRLDPELRKFMDSLSKSYGDKPVTMVNLIRFNEGMQEQYRKYATSYVPLAARWGGGLKIAGGVVHGPSNGAAGPGKEPTGSSKGEWWDDFSLVHFPSIRACCDLLVGDDYQAINKKYRTGTMKDVVLICATEMPLASQSADSKI